jgi:c-di-GMP-binding flagellar brake protein YcgR
VADLELQSQHRRETQRVDQRLRPRFKLDVEIRLYARNREVVRGHTVDISESGISGLFAVEVPIGEVVRLELSLPPGAVDIYAMVRQRNAFRYGFQFLDPSSAGHVIEHTCRQLAMEQDLFLDRSD